MFYEDEDGVFTTPALREIDRREMLDVADYLEKDGIQEFWRLAELGCYTENEKFWAMVWTDLAKR